ncbi:hypothetical protein [Streptomyces sp. NPDC002758]
MAIVALPFADGHTRFVTAHYDEDDDGHVVYLWDTVTGEQVGGPLPGPEFASNLVAVPTPDGRKRCRSCLVISKAMVRPVRLLRWAGG